MKITVDDSKGKLVIELDKEEATGLRTVLGSSHDTKGIADEIYKTFGHIGIEDTECPSSPPSAEVVQ